MEDSRVPVGGIIIVEDFHQNWLNLYIGPPLALSAAR